MNKKVDNYIKELDKLVIDLEIKELIFKRINYYLSHGKLYFDDNNLYGIYINKKDGTRAMPAKEFLEIKIDGCDIICNFSEWSNRKIVNITQNTLKGGNTKIQKKETVKVNTYNENNEFDNEEQEKIYNYQNRLIYDYKLKSSKNYDTGAYNDSGIIYNGLYWDNYFELEKNWYIENGSIFKYNLRKHFMADDPELYELYSFCPHVSKNEVGDQIYKFVELDENLFLAYMDGRLDIDDVISEVKVCQKIKQKQK